MGDDKFIMHRWNDAQGPALAGLRSAAVTVEAYRDTPALMEFYQHNQDDEQTFYHQLDHGVAPESVFNLHIHLLPMAGVGGNAYFYYCCYWVQPNQELPALAGWTTGNIALAIDAADQYKHKVKGLVSLPAPAGGASFSDILICHISRLGTDPLDTYSTDKATPPGTAAANLGILFIDGHIKLQSAGSVVEYGDPQPGY